MIRAITSFKPYNNINNVNFSSSEGDLSRLSNRALRELHARHFTPDCQTKPMAERLRLVRERQAQEALERKAAQRNSNGR